MIRYRLPHNFPFDRDICIDCKTTREQIEDGKKSRYCRKNRNHKSGRPDITTFNFSKWRVVEELVEEGLYGDFGEIAAALGASIIDDICDDYMDSPAIREQLQRWYGESMLPGIAGAKIQFMPGRVHDADFAVEPREGFHGWGFLKIQAITDEEMRDMKPGAFVQVAGEPEINVITKREISKEEHCKMFCAWKGGGPCLATDCPRREKHENGDGV